MKLKAANTTVKCAKKFIRYHIASPFFACSMWPWWISRKLV